MKLLVSPINPWEAREAYEGGADIIDIKNPSEGSLGASYPWTIKEIKNSLPGDVVLSATIGDLDNRPGYASQAAYGLAQLGTTYIKAGLNVPDEAAAINVARSVVRSVKVSNVSVVLAAYADHKIIGSIPPKNLAEIAHSTGAQGIMIDTYNKKGSSLFDHMSTAELKHFIKKGRQKRLAVALAGSIQTKNIEKIRTLNPHIIGVRSAVCTEQDRLKGKIEREKVKEFKALINNKKGRVV